MATVAFPPVSMLLMLVLMGPSRHEVPQDALAVLDPGRALEMLGRGTGEDALRKAIRAAGGGEEEAEDPGELDAAVERAIQNLASRSDALRRRAREELVEAGAALLPRLKELVEEDERRAEEAQRVIEAIRGRQASARHEEILAAQLAIRQASKEEITALVPEIRAALGSDSPFVRLAAADALARLGEEVEEAPDFSTPADGFPALAALPAGDTRMILAASVGPPLPGKDTIRDMRSLALEVGEKIGESPEEDELREGERAVLDFVRRFGNLRPERAYLVQVGKVGPSGGGLGIIGRGLYDRGVLESTLSESPAWTTTEVEGYTVYNAPFLRLVPLDDRGVLILPVMASAHFPLEAYLGNLAAGKNALAGSDAFGGFLRALEDDLPVRGLAVTDDLLMAEIYDEASREMPADAHEAFRAMERLALTVSEPGDDELLFRLEARFGEDGAADTFAGWIRAQIDSGIRELEGQIERYDFPGMRFTLQIMKAIKVSGEGRTGVLRLSLRQLGLEELISLFAGDATVEIAK